MTKGRFFKISLALITTSLIGYGCGGGGGGSSSSGSVDFSGSFGSDYSFHRKGILDFLIPKAFASYGSVKRIIAIPIVNSRIVYEVAKLIDVNSDGTFSVNLEKTYTYNGTTYKLNWILLIEKTDGDFEFLGISSANDSLINIPVGDITSGRIDLGVINKSNNRNDEASGDLSLTEFSQYTDLDLNSLEEFVKLDDIVKSVINLYVNNYGKPRDEYIAPKLHVVASGDYNVFRDNYSMAQNFQGYAFHIHTGSSNTISQNFENICNNNKKLKLYPSGNVVANNITYNQSNPFQTQYAPIQNRTDGGRECGSGIYYLRKDTDGSLTINFITGDTSSALGKTKPIPSGWFYLKLGNQNIAKFKFSYSLPLTRNNSYLKVPTPSVKLKVDNNNRVVGAYVKWYIYNENTSQFEEVSPQKFKWLVSYYGIHMDDFDGTNSNNSRLEIACDEIPIEKSYVDFTKDCKNYEDIYYNYGSQDKYSLDDFNLNINIYDNEYRFTYRKP